ncbi:MAG: hypothetical protein Q8L85_03490 [Alphaproteobacteria bacterium]|nr:hypothetical protein [Alphaproteobacteria bacterium]
MQKDNSIVSPREIDEITLAQKSNIKPLSGKSDEALTRDFGLSRHSRLGFAIALFLSGCAALAYQVAWQRALTQIIGSDAISMVLVVTIFMICLGVGSELAKFLVARSERQALILYILIETGVGIYGVFSIPLLRTANFVMGGGDSLVFDFMLNLILLAIPIIGMGLTTPLIVHIAKQKLQNIGRTAGALYSWNIAGAAIGAVLTGLVFMEATGLIGTTRIAAALNFVAALIAFGALASTKKHSSANVAPKLVKTSIPLGAATAAVLFGFGTLAIQMIFFRILSSYLTLSTIVFPVMLCSYLCLMAFGQWVGGQLADRYHDRLPSVVVCLFAIGAILFLAALRFPPDWAAPLQALRFSSFNGQLIAADYPQLVGDPSPIVVFLFSLFLMIAVVPWSGLFPVMFRLITTRVEEAGNRFARMYTLYTVGNVAGAFLCGILFLSFFGTGGSATATVLLVGLGCFVLLLSKRISYQISRYTWGIFVLGTTTAILMPQDYYKTFKLGGYSVTDVFEGRTGVATVVPTSRFYTIIDINRTASASALNADPVPSDMYQAWRWNHTDLMALDPTFRPKTILVIGIGHAYLIDAMLDLSFVEKITVVDISSEIVEAVKKYTKNSSKRIFNDPRVEIVVADGRRYIQSAIKRGDNYDLIQNKINEPWHAGGGNLFTEEFFREEKKLLNSGGYLSTRPLTGHLTDGLKIFGNALWAGYYHMYFKNGPIIEASSAIITSDIKTAWFADLPGRAAQITEGRDNLRVVYFSELPKEFATDPNTDDKPTFEYYWLRQLLGNWISPRLNLWDIDLTKYIKDVPVLVKNS